MAHGTLEMPPPPPREGDVVAGRYRLESMIGQGGFGSVWQANQIALGRQVALKMVLPELVANDEGVARFRREAQLAQQLEHPNTVRLYDFGQTDAGLPFIAFELLRGESLDHVLHKQGPLPVSRVVRIATQVLKALMEAHRLGIVHRDIKPANIFLTDFTGERDFVKVLDFGIAKATGSTNSTVLTQAGLSIGTPHYMPPEQVSGRPVGPPADLYALGLTMAEMLTGRIVLQGGGTEVYLQQLAPENVPLPPQVLASPIGPLIRRATEKDTARRPASAADMLRELEALAAMTHAGPFGPGTGAPFGAPPAFGAPPGPGGIPMPMPMTAGRPGGTQLAPGAMPVQPPAAFAPAPPQRSSSPIALIVIVGAALMVVGGAATYLTMSGSRSSDGPRSDKIRGGAREDPEERDPKKKKDPSPLDPSEEKALKRKLERLGWSITNESLSKQPSVTVEGYTASKGSKMAFVYLYRVNDDAVAKSMETSLRSSKGTAVARDGLRVLWVMMSPADAAAAQSLLEDLGF